MAGSALWAAVAFGVCLLLSWSAPTGGMAIGSGVEAAYFDTLRKRIPLTSLDRFRRSREGHGRLPLLVRSFLRARLSSILDRPPRI